MPNILLAIGAENGPIVGNEVRRVPEQLPIGTLFLLDDSSRDKADLQLPGQCLVLGEVFGGFAGLYWPARVGGHETTEVVFGENG
jgi:hypothetical protein